MPISLLVGCVLTAGTSACSGRANDAGREFKAMGLVVGRPTPDVLSIAHEEIPGYMPAMTMPFTLADTREQEGVSPGDRVRFTLRVTATGTRVHDIKVTAQDLAALDLHKRARSAASGRVRPGDSLPVFDLVDQDGTSLSVDSLRGHKTVLTFVFTRCPVPEFCPLIVGYFKQLQRAIVVDAALSDVRLLTVSLDPAFDTSPVLKAYGESMGADFRRWRFATGTPAQVAALTRAFAVHTEPSSAILDHTLATALLSGAGKVVSIWRGNQWTVQEVLDALRKS